MRSPPPLSTLFPYTTLFRSLFVVDEPAGVTRPVRERRRSAKARRVEPGHDRAYRHDADLLGDEERDRKSTRLNSSHVSISYAVFCLKKKNMTAKTECHPALA